MKRKYLKYEIKNIYMLFSNMKLSSFGKSIYSQKASIVKSEENQSNVLKNIVEFNNKSRLKNKEGKDKKHIFMKVHMLFMKFQNKLLMLSKKEYFQ